MSARLITIPFSHYCEKARWALDRAGIDYREDGHLPLFHYLATFPAGGKRTVPVVVTDEHDKKVLRDSTDIVAWADGKRPGSLIPEDPKLRAEALALEDEFDRQLGPATRRWAYFHILPRRDLEPMILRDVPRWEGVALRLTRPVAVGFLKRGLKIDQAGAERSRAKITQAFERTSEVLADRRKYLAGDRFTVADLAFASLAAPVLAPAEHPVEQPALDVYPAPAREQMTQWRSSLAGEHALRMYAEHRLS